MKESAANDERLGWLLDMQDSGTRGHPLRIAVRDDAAAAVRVAVLKRAVDHVGHGLETTVRVPGRALGLAWCVLDLSHLVHMDERVDVGQVDSGERAADRKALALEPVRGGRQASHGTLAGDCRVRLWNAWQDGDVGDGDGGHWIDLV